MKYSKFIDKADREIWQRVAKTVRPLKKGSSKAPDFDKDWFVRVKPDPKQKPYVNPPNLEMRLDKKTRRGKVYVDAKIDLHDLTQTQAFEKLRRAVIRAYNKNQRCLLVITGKGLQGQGVLRRNLPFWLAHDDIRPVIAEFAQAHIRHGGNGAFYVFLKSLS